VTRKEGRTAPSPPRWRRTPPPTPPPRPPPREDVTAVRDDDDDDDEDDDMNTDTIRIHDTERRER
jgi:hypothetical protein